MRDKVTVFRPLALAPLALVLANCGDDVATEEASTSDADATASGEVLGGAISDDMLPLDQLRSQSPAAPRAASAGSSSSNASSSNDDDAGESSQPASDETPEADVSDEAPASESSNDSEG